MEIFIQYKLNSRGLEQKTLSKPFSDLSLNRFLLKLIHFIILAFFLKKNKKKNSLAHYTL